MLLGASNPSGVSGRLLLRWSDFSVNASREEFVDIISRQASKMVVRSISEVVQNTRVFLVGKQYAASGTTRSCSKGGVSFVLAILIETESYLGSDSGWDPGVVTVEDFLSEEQEARILDDLLLESPVPLS